MVATNILKKPNSQSINIPVSEAIQKRVEYANSLAKLKKIELESSSQQMFLPGFDVLKRVMPNEIARCSLFAPNCGGNKVSHLRKPLVTRGGVTIIYTGFQFGEREADVWMQLIQDSMHKPLGFLNTFHPTKILKAIGQPTGGEEFTWLDNTMTAFFEATLFIEVRKNDGSLKYRIGDEPVSKEESELDSTDIGMSKNKVEKGGRVKKRGFRMLLDFAYDSATENYFYIIDPRWKTIFGENEYALISLEKRLQIKRGQQMAKTLQRLIATSADQPQRYKLTWLKEKMQYGSEMRKFRVALASAICELQRVGVINSGKIELSSRREEQLNLSIAK